MLRYGHTSEKGRVTMSDMFWEDDDRPRESNAMKALREKAEADSKKIAELTE